MNYTEKYHLPQWKKEDRVMMEDFNRMCQDMEAGLGKVEGAAGTAQKSADAAQRTADAALAALPYVTGTYTGTGDFMSFEVGFRPSFLIVTGMKPGDSKNTQNFTWYFGAAGGNALSDKVIFTETGFTIYPATLEYGGYPGLTTKDRVFDYIVFK